MRRRETSRERRLREERDTLLREAAGLQGTAADFRARIVELNGLAAKLEAEAAGKAKEAARIDGWLARGREAP